LWALPEEVDQAVLLRSEGLRPELARAVGAALAPAMTDQFTYVQKPVLLAQWSDARGASGVRMAVDSGLALLAPVTSHARLTGLLALGTRVSGETYGPLDLEHASAAAGMVGVALENTRLYHRLLEANRRLEETRDHLTEADRLKSEFIQNVNHELRTPLSIMVGYLEWLQSSGSLLESQERAVATVIEQAHRLSSLVQNLLDFSAAGRGELEVSCEVGHPGPILRSFADSRRPGVIEGLREFDLHIDEHLPPARYDGRRLLQILNILVDNAVRFTPLGTRIAVRARRATQPPFALAIRVEDNGPGILRQNIGAVFEPLRQGDSSTTREVGGIGMGLALARQLAESMGGTLVVESEVGRGTTFSLLLGS
jgi:signal transduction histidine kinase